LGFISYSGIFFALVGWLFGVCSSNIYRYMCSAVNATPDRRLSLHIRCTHIPLQILSSLHLHASHIVLSIRASSHSCIVCSLHSHTLLFISIVHVLVTMFLIHVLVLYCCSSMHSSLCSSYMYSYCCIVHVLVTMFLVHVLVFAALIGYECPRAITCT
jgi:hypothetical protein